MKKQKLVKALLYRAQVSESTLGHVHGMFYVISEIFIPKAKICMNEEGYAFIHEKPRSDKTVEIKISQKLMSVAKKIIEIEKLRTNIKELFSGTLKEEIDMFKKQHPVERTFVDDLRVEADEHAKRLNERDVSSGVIEMNKRGMDNPAALT